MAHKATSLFIALALLLSLPAVSVQAASGSTTITNCSESGLDAAIKEANAYNDTFRIYFNCPTKPTTIKLTSEKFLQGVVIIDGGGQVTLDGQKRVRIFNLASGGNYFLSNMTLQNGYASTSATANGADGGQGGAIYLAIWGNLHINNMAFSGNVAASSQATGLNYCPGGGAIALRGLNSAEIVGSYFYNNTGMSGGAISSMGGLIIKNSVFSQNHATHPTPDSCGSGGAIFIDGANQGQIALSNLSFVENTTNTSGGAVFAHLYQSDAMTIDGSVFEGNQSTFTDSAKPGMSGTGGAIWFSGDSNFNGRIYISNSTLHNNSSQGVGGAIYAWDAPLTFTNVTIDKNTSSNPYYSDFKRGAGGGLAIGMSNVIQPTVLSNVTITHNFGGYEGGGIASLGTSAAANIRISNTILANNSSGNSGKMNKNCTGTYVNLGGNIEYPRASGTLYDSICLKNTTSQDLADPQVLDAANNDQISVNGTPMLTVAIQANSPAINHGVTANCPARDQRSYLRIAACDSGAYEYNGHPFVPTDWLYMPLLRR